MTEERRDAIPAKPEVGELITEQINDDPFEDTAEVESTRGLLPEDAGGDTPPETDALTELEEAVGRTLSDDLTTEVTRLSSDDDDLSSLRRRS